LTLLVAAGVTPPIDAITTRRSSPPPSGEAPQRRCPHAAYNGQRDPILRLDAYYAFLSVKDFDKYYGHCWATILTVQLVRSLPALYDLDFRRRSSTAQGLSSAPSYRAAAVLKPFNCRTAWTNDPTSAATASRAVRQERDHFPGLGRAVGTRRSRRRRREVRAPRSKTALLRGVNLHQRWRQAIDRAGIFRPFSG